MEKSEKIEEIQFIIDFESSLEGKPVLHANQMTLQIHDNEAYLSFYQASPPVVVSPSQEELAELRSRVSIRPDCVARLTMSPHFLKKVFEVIQNNLSNFDIHEANERKDNGAKN